MRSRHLPWMLGAIFFALGSGGPARAIEKRECVAAHEQSQRLRLESKLLASRQMLLTCVQDACPALVRNDCAEWLSEIEDRIPSVVLEARDGANQELTQVRVFCDGAPLVDGINGEAINIDPGIHRFRFEAPGEAPIEQEVVIREGEHDRRLAVVFAGRAPRHAGAEPPSGEGTGRVPPAAYVTGALGILALGSFAYFGIRTELDAHALATSCSPYCSEDQVAPVRRELRAADISLGATLLFGGITTWLLLTRHRAPTAPPAAAASSSKSGGASPLFSPDAWSWDIDLGPRRAAALRWSTRF